MWKPSSLGLLLGLATVYALDILTFSLNNVVQVLTFVPLLLAEAQAGLQLPFLSSG